MSSQRHGYLKNYIRGLEHHYATYEEAANALLTIGNKCGGITQTHGGWFELRAGNKVFACDDRHTEYSWVVKKK